MAANRTGYIYTPAAICQLFRITRTTLFRWEKRGRIPRARRDREGNRIYTQEDFEYIGERVAERLETLTEKIQRGITELDSDSPPSTESLRELLIEYTLVKYLITREPAKLLDLKIAAQTGMLSENIRQRILELIRQHPADDDVYTELVEILHHAAQLGHRVGSEASKILENSL